MWREKKRFWPNFIYILYHVQCTYKTHHHFYWSFNQILVLFSFFLSSYNFLIDEKGRGKHQLWQHEEHEVKLQEEKQHHIADCSGKTRAWFINLLWSPESRIHVPRRRILNSLSDKFRILNFMLHISCSDLLANYLCVMCMYKILGIQTPQIWTTTCTSHFTRLLGES